MVKVKMKQVMKEEYCPLEKISVLFWNVSGAVDKNRARRIHHYIKNQPISPTVIGFVETRSVGVALDLNNCGYVCIKYIPVVGMSNGMEVWVKKGVKVGSIITFNNRIISVEIYMEEIKYSINFIYGSQSRIENNNMVKYLKSRLTENFIVIGDFNKLKLDSVVLKDGFIENGVGDKFTWTRKRESKVLKSRLDKVFYNLKDNLPVYHLEFVKWENGDAFSDHRPIWFPLVCDSANNKSRWIFPSWILKSEEVRKYIESMILNSKKGWYQLADKIRSQMEKIVGIAFKSGYNNIVEKDNYIINERDELCMRPNMKITNQLQQFIKSPVSGTLNGVEADEYFEKMYSNIDCFKFKKTGVVQELDFNIDLKDIENAVDSMKSGKMPGPSGFTTEFFQCFKSSIGRILLEEYRKMVEKKYVKNRWKEGFITLIPKKGDLQKINNWRGINLLNVEWKIFTSIIDGFIKKKWENEIHEDQIGFRSNKWIQQNILTLQAILKEYKYSKEGGCLFIDLKNAYPSVKHSWLKAIFEMKGGKHYESLCDLLLGGKSRVLFRGKLGRKFNMERGVKQGDIIAPLMFNLSFDPILRNIPVEGVQICGIKYKVIAYADDIVVFCKNKDEQIRVKRFFKRLERFTGLSINDDKTEWLPFRNSNTKSCWKVVNDFIYLGIKINRNGKILWDNILDKFEKRLAVVSNIWWRSQTLEYRVRIINSYCMSVLIYPLRTNTEVESIMDRIKKKVKKALSNKGTRVAYDRLVAGLDSGGYGLIDIEEMNIRLKRSWLNYIFENRDSKFIKLVNGWNEKVKSDAATIVGPLLSWNDISGETKIWRHLCQAFKGVNFYFNYCGKAWRWTEHDRSSREVFVNNCNIIENYVLAGTECFKSCDIVPAGYNDVDLLQNYIYKAGLLDKDVSLDIENRKQWKIISKSRVTPAQKRWRSEFNFNFIDELNRIKKIKMIPEKIKMWNRDLLNVNLATRYHKDKCRFCGIEINSKHFINECKNLKIIRRRIIASGINNIDKAEISWVNWISHCERLKNENSNIIAVSKFGIVKKRWDLFLEFKKKIWK